MINSWDVLCAIFIFLLGVFMGYSISWRSGFYDGYEQASKDLISGKVRYSVLGLPNGQKKTLKIGGEQ